MADERAVSSTIDATPREVVTSVRAGDRAAGFTIRLNDDSEEPPSDAGGARPSAQANVLLHRA